MEERMRFKVIIFCGLFAAVLCGCRAVLWNGMVGTSLVRTEYPRVTIAVNEPLTLQ
jgi:hypothetical protein